MMSSEIEDKLFHAAYVAKNQDGTRAIDSDLREVKGWASRPLVDRDDELIEWDAWELDDFNLNPVMMLSHDYRKPPIAQVIWINKSEEGLMFKAKFPPEAKSATSDEIFNLYEAGVMKAFSVGFKPLEWVDSQEEGEPKRRYTKVNLLEISGVGIPALQTALVGAYQDGQIKDPALMTVIKGMLSKDSQDEVEFDDDEYISKEIIEKPYKNEHSCQLASPGDFDKFARKNCYLKHDEKCIDVVFGIKAGKSKMQAYRYPKDIWTAGAARTHCKGKDGTFEAAKKTAAQELQAQEGGHLFSEEELRRIADELLAQEDTGSKADFFGQRRPLRYDFDAAVNRDGMWNKSLPKSFDIAQYDEANTVFRYSLFTKFLECEVKHIYVNSYDIPSPLIGTYLQAISEVTAGLTIDDTRRFSYDGKESPPSRDYIQLNSRERKRFLVNGSEYCHDNDMALIKDFSPGWRGLQFSIITSSTNEGRNDAIMDAIHLEADRNHMLKGEKFALSGEFLSSTDDAWDGLVIDNKDKQAITKSMEITSKADGNSRGLLFVGPPGTGKTKTGRTIMNDTSHTFIWLSTRDFTYGWPETILRLAFNMSRKLAPTVLFMEDVDNYLDTDLLKTELDGLKQNKGIMTILTTNHPEKLPKALLDRPGRFHHVILFDLPDEGQRRQMFRLWAGEIEKSILDKLIDATEGMSGAHINHLIEYSKIISEDEDIDIDLALVESMLRLSAQMELVAGLQPEQSKSVEDSSDITPDEALALLRLDAEEKAAAARLTADDMMREMQGRAD